MRTPQTEEIRLTIITTTKISNKFLRESQYIFNMFSQESPNFHASFHVCKRSLRHSKNLSGKSLDLEIQIFYKSDLLRQRMMNGMKSQKDIYHKKFQQSTPLV